MLKSFIPDYKKNVFHGMFESQHCHPVYFLSYTFLLLLQISNFVHSINRTFILCEIWMFFSPHQEFILVYPLEEGFWVSTFPQSTPLCRFKHMSFFNPCVKVSLGQTQCSAQVESAYDRNLLTVTAHTFPHFCIQ